MTLRRIPSPVRRALDAPLRLLALILFVAVGHARLPAQTPTPTPIASGRITGRVVDVASGQPLTHAQVGVVGQTLGGETDLDGRYTINGVPVGKYSVQARHIGYQQNRYATVTVTAGTATVVDFTIGAASGARQSMGIQEVRT